MQQMRHVIPWVCTWAACFPGPLAPDADVTLDANDIDVGPEVASDVTSEATSLEVADADGGADALSVEADACVATGPEQCNGLDDDCSGGTDEGFLDTNTDGEADCVDLDDDGDGIADDVDDEPLVAWVDPCLDPLQLGATLGCAFWSVDLPVLAQSPDEPPPYSLVITNPSERRALVRFEYGAEVPGPPPPAIVVEPGSNVEVQLPATQNPKGLSSSGVLMTTNQPVSVLQLNTHEATILAGSPSLLPVHALGHEHVIVAWPTLDNLTALTGAPNAFGWTAIIATEDDTIVEVQTSAQLEDPDVLGVTGLADLDRGQVLFLRARGRGNPISPGEDLTGTRVTANHPVAVFAGHDHAPFFWTDTNATCCGGGLAAQMLPVELSGSRFASAPPLGTKPDPKHVWRVVAFDDDVFIRSNASGLNQRLLEKRGDWLEWYGPGRVFLRATGRIGLYLLVPSQLPNEPESLEGLSVPALIPMLPLDAWTTIHHVTAIEGHTSHVTIIRITNSEVALDGELLPASAFSNMPDTPSDFAPGQPRFQSGHVALSPGTHRIIGATPISVTLLGYAPRSTYAAPIGGTGMRMPRLQSPPIP